jgi:hypothetical protein
MASSLRRNPFIGISLFIFPHIIALSMGAAHRYDMPSPNGDYTPSCFAHQSQRVSPAATNMVPRWGYKKKNSISNNFLLILQHLYSPQHLILK